MQIKQKVKELHNISLRSDIKCGNLIFYSIQKIEDSSYNKLVV